MHEATVAFHTLGCKLNFSESNQLGRKFEQLGYRAVPFDRKADVYVINTCSVTENADRECRTVVQRAMRRNPDAFIAVTGCYAQLKPGDVAALEGVDLVAGASAKFSLPDLIGEAAKKHAAEVFGCDIGTVGTFEPATSSTRTRTFLKVQDGCDYTCAFCTIPLARGRSRSDTIENAVNRARQATAGGAREIVLTGVNLGDFRDPNGEGRFIDLARTLDTQTEIPRIRISSIEPNLLDDELIEFVAGSKRFMPHFHIPLQSGSDRILKSMRRRYLTGLYRSRIEKIKNLLPHAGIGADVITGFPGETEDDFGQTVDFIESLGLSYLHAFTYSERENTEAVEMAGSVSPAVRKMRTRTLRELSAQLATAFSQRHENKPAFVLFENNRKGNLVYGYTENYIKTRMPFDPALVNSIEKVVLEKPGPDGMTGRLADASLIPGSLLDEQHAGR